MNESKAEQELHELIQNLSPAKRIKLLGIAKALATPIEAKFNYDAGLVTPAFADEFTARIQLHHATHSKQLERIAIEDAFRASSAVAGRRVNGPMSATTRFIDEIIDGEKIALKGSAAKGVRQAFVHISKLCEAAWIQDVRGAVPRMEATKRQIKEYIDTVDRIYQLRVIPDKYHWIYQLVEIPISLFEPILKLDKNHFAPDGPRIPITDASGLCMQLILDRSDSKITISKVPIERCIIHAEWQLLKQEPIERS